MSYRYRNRKPSTKYRVVRASVAVLTFTIMALGFWNFWLDLTDIDTKGTPGAILFESTVAHLVLLWFGAVAIGVGILGQLWMSRIDDHDDREWFMRDPDTRR